jgi:hypothetical protein
MKYGSEGDKGWDASSPDAPWSGSSGTLGGASQDCATHAPWMANGFRISRTSSDLSLDSNSASRASNMSSRCDKHLPQTSSLLAHLLAIYREELAWLAGILREPRCGAVIRDIDGAIFPVLLAFDRDCQLVGADHGSRQILGARGMELKPGLRLAAFLPIFATKSSCSHAQRVYSITWHSRHRSPTT